jgi:hypothetical protein
MSFEKPSVEAPVEAGIEQEQKLPTTENLQQEMAVLKAKVEAARLQKEKDVETAKQQKEVETGEKVTERELLIGEARSNVELLAQAHETLDYFVTMQELGDLDEADTQKLEELKTLVATLEQKRDEIDEKIGVISSAPEVLDKIQDAAKKEEAQHELKQLEENFHGEFDPKIDKLADEFNLLFTDPRLKASGEVQGKSYNVEVANNKVRDAISKVNRGVSMVDAKGVATMGQIDVAWQQSEGAIQFYNKIAVMRSEAGMFEGKKKAVLDALMEKVKPLLSEVAKAEGEHKGVKEQISSYEADKVKVLTGVKELMAQAGPVNDKYESLTGDGPQSYNRFADGILKRFKKKVGTYFGGPEFDSLIYKDVAKR